MCCSLMHCKHYVLTMACLVVLLQYFQIVWQWRMFLFFKDFRLSFVSYGIYGDYYKVEEGMNFCYSFLVTLFVHI